MTKRQHRAVIALTVGTVLLLLLVVVTQHASADYRGKPNTYDWCNDTDHDENPWTIPPKIPTGEASQRRPPVPGGGGANAGPAAFYQLTGELADKKTDRLRATGAYVPDPPYCDQFFIENHRNARIRWHVTAHELTETIDYTLRCRLSYRGPKQVLGVNVYPPGSGIQIKCRPWREFVF